MRYKRCYLSQMIARVSNDPIKRLTKNVLHVIPTKIALKDTEDITEFLNSSPSFRDSV